MKPAARRKLDRDIAAALAVPNIKDVPLREYMKANGERAKRDEKRMHQALLKYQAMIVTRRDGKRVLLIQSGEMSNPSEGAFRVTEYWDDGPRGHITRTSILRLAQDLATDVYPEAIAPASEDDVMRWFGTRKFIEGSEHVFEMQRRNQR